MIKKLNSSLTGKIFLITTLLLTICCVATYGCIAWLLPKTFQSQIPLDRAELYAYEAAQELRQATSETYSYIAKSLQESYHAQLGNDLMLHIFNEDGFEISWEEPSLPLNQRISHYPSERRTQEYSFILSDVPHKYTLILADSSLAVNQAIDALAKAFPYLIVTILLIALLTSFVYSIYITTPIKKLNHISQKMAVLDFDVKCSTKRTDELGGVSQNLNQLAETLSDTLHQLEAANAKLLDDIQQEQQLELQRMELFSSVSHELKTPITIVKGQLQGMIGNVGRYKDRDAYLLHSLKSITDLEAMVQELLIIARMETPGYVCSYQVFDIAALLRKSLTAQEDLFIQKEMELVLHLPDSLIYKGDQQLLKRTFDNLISNALNYSPQGNTILVHLSEDEKGILFSIENTGVHIDEKELPRLFEVFYRTEQSRNRQTGGSGLGLYIVKKVLDLHNASYSIGNTSEGTIFSIAFSSSPF